VNCATGTDVGGTYGTVVAVVVVVVVVTGTPITDTVFESKLAT
jgi:hypothetical protein